ncbi:MAG TPA: efflux RND transporter permease subunit [Hyphomicrobiales bacterium]|nr:efflux RND transporter permease subunit [Hyphomicrobiales bacterium]
MKLAGQDLPALSVKRPYLVIVLNLLIIIAGVAALLGVEVREMPDIDRPVVSVRVNYPGASPETLDAEVTSVLERAVARVTGVKAVRSSSEENNARIRIEFSPSANLIDAANDVRETVSRAARSLPGGVEDVRVIKADADAGAVMELSVASRTLKIEEMTRIVEDVIIPQLTSVDGVADVDIDGERKKVLRIVVNPNRLASLGLSIRDISTLVSNARFDVPAGSFISGNQEILLRANASVTDPERIRALQLKENVRLGDVADVYFGPDNEASRVRIDGSAILSLGIIKQAKANTVAISKSVRDQVASLNERLRDLSITVIVDDAEYIEGAIWEVAKSLTLAILIVIGVIWLFMGRLGPTLAPAVTIPVALTGAVALIWLFGFSINLITLLALVLATGLVVDDAIVVLENIQRCQAQGMKPKAAAVIGTRQVFFAVIATTATLVAVFVPISFLPSQVGRLFREFGFMLAATVGISSFVALTLCPMIASKLSLTGKDNSPRFFGLDRLGNWLVRLYARILDVILAAPLVMVAIACAIGLFSLSLYALLGQELMPREDRGVVRVWLNGPDGINLDHMDRQVEKVEALLQPYVDSGQVERIYSLTGWHDVNRALISAPLKPWGERTLTEQQIIAELSGPVSQIPGAVGRVSGGGGFNIRNSGASFSFVLTGSNYPDILEASDKFIQSIEREVPQINNTRLDYSATQPEISVNIDRERAANLDVDIQDLASTISVLVDGQKVTELTVDDQAVPVYVEAMAGVVTSPSDLANLYVRSRGGQLVPLMQMVTFEQRAVAAQLDRYEQRRAIRIRASLAEGVPLRAAVDAVRDLAARELPLGINLLFLSDAASLEEAEQEITITFAVAILVAFLVLVAQFESLTSAIVIIVTVPFGIAAAILALLLSGVTVNIFSQIGILVLIGIMAKNGILMVEFADQLRDRGASVMEAAREAAIVRLRPIVMTMASTIIAGLPLIFGEGPGEAARASIGWVIFGGLGLSAAFTLFLVPAIYVLLAWMSKPRASAEQDLSRQLSEIEG